MTGHSPQVYDAHYVRPFRDAEEREIVRNSLASIGFGNEQVDQSVDQTADLSVSMTRETTKGPVSRAFLGGAYRDRTGDLRLAKPALSQLS